MPHAIRSRLLAAAWLPAAGVARAEGPGLDPGKAVTQYAVDAWTTENGLPQNTVNALAQTPEGYLWLGTYDGLARFDGVRFTVFNKGTADAFKDNGVRALCRDADGALWIGTNGGGLTRWADGRFTHFSAGQGPSNDMVWALAPAGGGGVWVGTNGGSVYLLRDGRFRPELTGPAGESVYALLQDRHGRLWAGTHGGGLKLRSPDGAWTRYTTANGLPSNFVRSLLEDSRGRLWIGTLGGGLVQMEEGRFRTYGVRDGLPDDVVSAIVEDRRGSLWLATRRGIARWREGAVARLDAAHGLPYDVTYALFEDREGSLWIGTAGAGAARLRDGSFTVHGVREGLADDFVYPIHEDGAGRVWVGTARGLSRQQDGRWTTLTSRDGLCHDAVRSLWVGPSDELWVGTYGGGACRLAGTRWTRYGSRDGLAHDNVRAVLGTRDGSVWVGTLGGLSRLVGSRWRTYTTADGLPANSVIALREDRAGVLWIGTDGGGLACYRDGRFQAFVGERPLPSAVVLVLHEDREGTLWIGTGGGLARLREGSLATFTTRAGLPADSVHQILDAGDDLWIGGARGVYRVSKSSLDDYAAGRTASVAPLVLGKSDGLRSLQCTAPAQPAGFRTRDGRLWFATARGVAVLDPARIRIETSPPPMVIESVLAEDQVFDSPRDLFLGPGRTRLAFQYTGLGLLAPERLGFRHRLVGFDEDWIDAGDRRAAYYTGLPPGEYRFEVAGRSGGGSWSPTPASVRVTLRPRFYQTRTFYLLAVVGVMLLALAAHRVRVARLHERQRELARLVEERTHSLREAKEQAEAAQQESERRRRIIEEADAVKTELLGIAVHDLKNPLQSVLTASEILQLSPDRPVAEPARVVHSSALRMFGLVNDLLATAAVEGKIDLRLAPVDVGRTAQEVVEDYRQWAERKEQSLRLVSQEGCLALADVDRTRDIIDNLVSNALKYTPARGRIDVAVNAPSAVVRVEVQDRGPGLTEDDRRRLFGRFQRLSARPTGGEPSTGLGLYIVKRLTEAMGGRVWVETDGPGTGSRFVVELPKAG